MAPAVGAGMPSPAGGAAPARARIRVIYGDTDQAGIVYYANYLRYFEAGRAELIRSLGLAYAELEARHGVRLPVIEARVTYRAPARYDDLLVVETRLGELGRASLRFDYRVLRGDEPIAEGLTRHACADLEGRARRMPAELIQRLRAQGPGPQPTE